MVKHFYETNKVCKYDNGHNLMISDITNRNENGLVSIMCSCECGNFYEFSNILSEHDFKLLKSSWQNNIVRNELLDKWFFNKNKEI
jgi:hypothetical protein